MKDISVSVPDKCYDSITVAPFTSIPLFKFNDHGIVVEKFVSPGDHAVQALGRQWKFVFQQHSMIMQSSHLEDL